jgi:glycosyltransferase involved in cell wall biosynthesis
MAHRILHVSNVSRISGAENSLLQLLQGTDRREFEPLAALPGPGPLAEELARLAVPAFYAPLARPRRTLNPVRLASLAGRTAAASLVLARESRRHGVCLIHAHTTAAFRAAGPAARMAGVPCVWHVRDIRRLSSLDRRLGRFANAAIAVSEAVLKESGLSQCRGLDLRVIPNGIDADAFESRARRGMFRQELGLGPEDPLLLVAAQMVPWKGHRDFLRAVASVRGRHHRTVAALAGDDLFGDYPRYVPELRRLAASLGLEQAVRFLGYRTDVPTLMADADILVIPSDAEPFGRVALEAMAVGTPVVGRWTGGLPEVIADGVTGRLARSLEADAAEALGQVISDLLSDPEARAAMGKAGRTRVRELFGLERHAAEVCAVYRHVLGAVA